MTAPPTPGTDDREWSIEASIRSEPCQATKLIQEVLSQLEQLGWGGRDLFGVHMAMEEALMNAIKHGNCHDAEKNISVQLRFDSTSFFARIVDQGSGFDPDRVPDPTSEDCWEAESGRGLALIRNFMDTVQFNATGNQIEMSKRRQP